MTNGKEHLSSGIWLVVLFLLVVGIVLSGPFAPPGWNWILVILLMSAFIAVIGHHITGRWSGILINERNTMTLSRFQLVIWTLIILSAFITIALERVIANEVDPLAIAIPWQLWALMGISTTSLVGSPLILNTKTGRTPTRKAQMKEAESSITPAMVTAFEEKATNKDPLVLAAAKKAWIDERIATEKAWIDERVDKYGILNANKSPMDAEFSEMFRGDEKANSSSVDMAKVQMFFFTLIAAISYIVLLFNWIMTKAPAGLTSFPQLSEGLIAILGISHGGYLANKTYDHARTEGK